MTEGLQTVIPKVSIIIPCYNVACFVSKALDSALSQTYSNVEVVVVDDASQDNLAEVLNNYKGHITICEHKENSGLAATRNTGVRHANGEILAFLDADDWWPNDLLKKLVPQVQPGQAVCYDNYVVSEDKAGKPGDWNKGETLLAEWLTRGPRHLNRSNMEKIVSIPSLFKIIVTHKDYKDVDGFDLRFFGIEDFHFYVKLLSYGTDILITPEPKGYYLVQKDSILRTITRDKQKQLETLLRWWQMFSVMPKELVLSEEAVKECHIRRTYYRARYVDALLRRSITTRDYRSMMNMTFLRDAVQAIPEILRFKMQGLAQKLHMGIIRGAFA